jgi:hypothetical protein
MPLVNDDRVCRVAMPPAARAHSTLSQIDYEDAFLVDVGPVEERTAEQWARAILEDSPTSIRTSLMSGWRAIGLKVGSDESGQSVLGWQVRRCSPDFILLGADSCIGLPGELLFTRMRNALLFNTFTQHGNLIARAVWAATEPTHVRVVRYILEQASRRLRP